MSRAKAGSAIWRPDLGQVVNEFMEGPQMGFIGLEVMPIFRTAIQAGAYPVIPKEALLKISPTDRAPRGGYQRGDWTYERGTFATVEQGWEEPLDDVEKALFDQEAGGEAERVSTLRAWNKIMRAQEKGSLMRLSTRPIFRPMGSARNGIPIRPLIRSGMSKMASWRFRLNAGCCRMP